MLKHWNTKSIWSMFCLWYPLLINHNREIYRTSGITGYNLLVFFIIGTTSFETSLICLFFSILFEIPSTLFTFTLYSLNENVKCYCTYRIGVCAWKLFVEMRPFRKECLLYALEAFVLAHSAICEYYNVANFSTVMQWS